MIHRIRGPALLRAALVTAAALGAVTLGTDAALPLPDLVLPVVVAGALLSGPTGGALLGLAAGWVVDVMPPGAAVLGTGALVYAAVGLVAGAGRREGEAPLGWLTLVVAAAVLALAGGRVAVALLTASPVAWGELLLRTALTVALGGATVPLLITLERALARRAPR